MPPVLPVIAVCEILTLSAGDEKEIMKTEMLRIEHLKESYFVVRYVTTRRRFWKYRRAYTDFLKTIILPLTNMDTKAVVVFGGAKKSLF